MRWLVTVEFEDGSAPAVVEVIALNRADALYRGAVKAEVTYGRTTGPSKAVRCK